MSLKVKNFAVLEDYRIRVTFSNGDTCVVDLKDSLSGEIFEPLKDKNFFKKARLTEWNVIEWPNGADFAPEFLYEMARIGGQKSAGFDAASRRKSA